MAKGLRIARLIGLIFAVQAIALYSAMAWAGEAASVPWDLQQLSKPPATRPAPGIEAEGVKAFFYDGLPWQDKPTRVFNLIAEPQTGLVAERDLVVSGEHEVLP